MAPLGEFSTPMMQQYAKIKQEYQDAILFFRLGDFYEMFLEDAKVGSRVLGITLTARDKGQDGRIPMAGIPYHAAESYLQKLVRAGYKVAICEQTSEPTVGKEIVEREVVRVVTPSTLLSENESRDVVAQYLMSFSTSENRVGVCLISLGQGEVLVGEEVLPKGSRADTQLKIIFEQVERFQPVEILLIPKWYDQVGLPQEFSRLGVSPFRYQPSVVRPSESIALVESTYQVQSIEGFGLTDKLQACEALAIGLDYLGHTQKKGLSFLKKPQLITTPEYLTLSGQTIRNLELFNSIRWGDTQTSLYAVINHTTTAMGARMLRNWLLRPLLKLSQIESRLDAVEWLLTQANARETLNHYLNEIGDLERNLSRLAMGVGNPRDLVSIRQSLQNARQLWEELREQTGWPAAIEANGGVITAEPIERLVKLLTEAVDDDPPVQVTDGGVIRAGYSNELDQIREVTSGGREWLVELENRERVRTQISSLKIGVNKVAGYYIEVSKANIDKVPGHYVRRQTLTNAERFIIPELQEHEREAFDAEAKALRIEQELFFEISQAVVFVAEEIQSVASWLARVDVFNGFTTLAEMNHYVRPELVEEHVLEFTDGCHPVVAQLLSSSFVPNSINLREEENRMIILTGANMAGKSTYIRQVALLVILGQIGSFVPAKSMRFHPVDQIHTRIGAADQLSAGLSTFMVEMVETASILNNLTKNSLVILDEVGRGTSTYDGLSIAWAVSEYLVQKSVAMVLFATHYHELAELQDMYDHVANYSMAVAENAADLAFLYRVKPGVADQSYGIEVARHAGLPTEVVDRARVLLADLNHQAHTVTPSRGRQQPLFFNEQIDAD